MGRCLLGMSRPSGKEEAPFVRIFVVYGSITLTLRGTIKAIGSIVLPYTLYARAISHSETFRALLGRKHMPR